MANKFSSNPLIRSGWARAALYLTALLLLTGISLIVYVLAGKKPGFDISAAQGLFNADSQKYFTLSALLLIVGVTYAFRHWIDRKSFISLGLHLTGYWRQAIAGGSLAIFIVTATGLILKLTGHLKWTDIIFDPRAVFLSLGSVFITAFYEELIFRGYLLTNLLDSFRNWIAIGISTILFLIFHWNSNGFFPLMNTVIFGLILGLNFVYTGNLWFSICFHTAWKFIETTLLGFPGNDAFQTLMQTELHGDDLITGGAAGLEGSGILMAVSLLSGMALYFILQKKISLRSRPVPGRI